MIRFVAIEQSPYLPVLTGEANDCIVLRKVSNDSNSIEMAFPFQPDSTIIHLSIIDAIMLRNAIDDLVSVKFLEKTGGQ
ncbi:hypothetical protein J31TS6_57370 [Brevibacillus reuszeri]|uniref:hypothetical protein n=1 Tax=Brevibacillus reuszeri TaxID=54915 RepID=UPI001B0758D5|nr:hypothetical protein [Brevibacillus reuszeri]GIO09709.1 hypothetical protein J31TS6_57370 [Brevibacillus reuszeri]